VARTGIDGLPLTSNLCAAHELPVGEDRRSLPIRTRRRHSAESDDGDLFDIPFDVVGQRKTGDIFQPVNGVSVGSRQSKLADKPMNSTFCVVTPGALPSMCVFV